MSQVVSGIQSALQDVWNWFQGVANPIENSLGTLGAWLFGGIKWLADQIYSALTWLADKIYGAWTWFADKLHDAYSYLAQWISGGLQWIGSGLSWIGQHIYAFGQWLWNGLLWIARTVASALENFINWVWQHIVSIWNTIMGYVKGFISAMNDHINSWIEASRDKFVKIVAVNIGIETLYRGLENLHKGRWKWGLLELLFAPAFGQISASIIDGMIPRPHTTKVMIFPEIDVHSLEFSPITIEKPPVPSKPEYTELPNSSIPLAPVGYVPNVSSYSIIESGYRIYTGELYGTLKKLGNTLKSEYSCNVIYPYSAVGCGKVSSGYLLSLTKSTILVGNNNVLSSGINYVIGHLLQASGFGIVSDGHNIGAVFPYKSENKDTLSSSYNTMIIMPITESCGNSASSEFTVTLLSPVTRSKGNLISSGYETKLIKPVKTSEGNYVSSGYVYYLAQSGYSNVIYESFES